MPTTHKCSYGTLTFFCLVLWQYNLGHTSACSVSNAHAVYIIEKLLNVLPTIRSEPFFPCTAFQDVAACY